MGALERISKAVKAFGGEGRIHGAIVDIDHFSHIYLNPFDGSVSYYYATPIVDKHFYADLASLLSTHVPSLLPRYTATLHESGESVAVLSNIDAQLADVKNALRVIDTTMYRPSRVLRSIQYLFDSKVIRVWNEEALNLARIRGWGEGLCEPGTSGPLLPE